MKFTFSWPGLRLFKTIGWVLTLGASVTACSQTTWKEEVLLHDGSKILVTRTQSRGGRGEIGQSPIKEQAISFELPGSGQSVTWKDEYSEDVGHSNFDLLALHVLNDTAYIVTSAYGSSAYHKWGSPNPPYILFKFNGATWQRIALAELPIQFKDLNFTNNSSAHEKKLTEQSRQLGFVLAATIKEFNSSLTQEEFKSIVRTPLEIWKPRPDNSSFKAPQPLGASSEPNK